VSTVVDIERPTSRGGVVSIGWIGAPYTAPYLKYAEEALHALGKSGRAKVLLIGSRAVTAAGCLGNTAHGPKKPRWRTFRT
jgi:hypothetical protein